MDVRTLCLGVLSLEDKSGYAIKKYFEEHFCHFFVAGFGSIYPALATLRREGLVEEVGDGGEGRAERRVYRITAAGRDALEAALAATAPRHKVRSEFLALLYFAHLLSPERLGEVLDERARDIESVLEVIDRFEATGGGTPGQAAAAAVGRATLEAQREWIRGNREALVRERTGGPEVTP